MQETMRSNDSPVSNSAIALAACLLLVALSSLSSSCTIISDPPPERVLLQPQAATNGKLAAKLPFSMPFDWTKNKIVILPAENWGLFKPRDTIIVQTTDNSPITIFDLYGRTVHTGRSPSFLNLPCGHYFVECKGDRDQFAVLPNDYDGAPFLADMAKNKWQPWAQRERQMQVTWVRSAAAAWKDVQPQSTVWNWAEMDDVIGNNPGKKLMVMAGTGNVPVWVQPANLTSNCVAYVTALANRYKGKIAAIEIWNEPRPGNFWDSPNWLHMLADLFTAGRTAIKAVDANILVLGPSWSTPGQAGYTAVMAQHGFGTQIDGLSWHDYWAYDVPPDQDITRNGNVIPGIVGRVQRYRQAAGFNGPLYISELGLYGQCALGIPYPPIPKGLTGGPVFSGPGWQTGTARAIKYAVMYRAMGAEMMMPLVFSLGGYSMTDDQNSLYGWDYGYRGPTPRTSAFLMACYWLNGAKFVGYKHDGTLWEFRWLRHDQPMTFMWSEEGHTNPFADSATRITDIYGSRLLTHGNSLAATEITATPLIAWGVK
jgi:hypothetical protein